MSLSFESCLQIQNHHFGGRLVEYLVRCVLRGHVDKVVWLHPLLNVGVLQGLVDADPLGWFQHQYLVQELFELNHFLPLVFW